MDDWRGTKWRWWLGLKGASESGVDCVGNQKRMAIGWVKSLEDRYIDNDQQSMKATKIPMC